MTAAEQRLLAYIQKTLANKALTAQTALFSSGLLDSFGFINLISYLEKEFSVRIPLKNLDPNKFDTVLLICQQIKKTQHGH